MRAAPWAGTLCRPPEGCPLKADGGIIVGPAVIHTTICGRFRFDELGTRSLKGFEQPMSLFSVSD